MAGTARQAFSCGMKPCVYFLAAAQPVAIDKKTFWPLARSFYDFKFGRETYFFIARLTLRQHC